MLNPVRHFYHIWLGPAWERVAAEHADALLAGGWDHPVTVGLVGAGSEVRAEARGWFRGRLGCTDFVESNAGFEEQTLAALWLWAREEGQGGAVLYMHAKGVWDRSAVNQAWRRGMTAVLLGGWQARLAALADCDAAGPHWLQPGDHPMVSRPFFGGNFWFARSDYVASLPVPLWRGDRYDAETWLAQGNPKVLNLRAGWPPDFYK